MAHRWRNRWRNRWIIHQMIGSLSVLALSVLAGGCGTSPIAAPPSPVVSPSPLNYRQESLPTGELHILTIPAGSPWRIAAVVSPTLEPVAQLAKRVQAVAAINAGFFDPSNGQSTAFITHHQTLVADPRQTDRLTQNPTLQAYLPQIFNRSEFRHYRCGPTPRYAITPHRAPVPSGCALEDAIGGGPQLLPTLNATEEAFLDVQEGQVVRDPIGVNQRSARSAIGLTVAGDVVWVMVAQRIRGVASEEGRSGASEALGLTLPELAAVMKRLGAETALNLDGGSSSGFFYQNHMNFGQFDSTGAPIQRAVKSVWVVQPLPP